jgi:hypothetical protein
MSRRAASKITLAKLWNIDPSLSEDDAISLASDNEEPCQNEIICGNINETNEFSSEEESEYGDSSTSHAYGGKDGTNWSIVTPRVALGRTPLENISLERVALDQRSDVKSTLLCQPGDC